MLKINMLNYFANKAELYLIHAASQYSVLVILPQNVATPESMITS